MSDDASENDGTNENASEPETSQPSDTQQDSQPTEPRVPDSEEYPQYMRGKKLSEVGQQFEALMQTVGQPQQQGQQNPQPQNQNPPLNQHPQAQGQQNQSPPQPRNAQGQYQSPQQPQQNQQPSGPPSPDLYYEDQAEYRRQMQQWQQQQMQQAQQQVAQQLQPMMQGQAQQAKMAVKRDPEYEDVFSEYEPEIVAEMQQIPPQNQTVEAWQTAAEMVAGRHRKELAQKAAEQMQTQQPSPTARQGGGAPGEDRSYRDKIDEFWDSDHEYVKFCKNQGMSAQDLRDRAAQMDLRPEEFVELVQQDNIVASNAGLTATEK